MSNVSPEKFPDPVLDVAAGGDAVLAGGCFWCTEAVYRQLDGVTEVMPGYAGGTADTADYDTVSTGRTGHAEAIRIRFDPAKTSYAQLLKVFFSIAHDPTQRDGQGADIGRQYRSAVFYSTDEQRRVAEAYVAQLDGARAFDDPIVTEIVPLERFYEAEPYHVDYAARNASNPYIRAVALPKVKKVRTYFADRVRPG